MLSKTKKKNSEELAEQLYQKVVKSKNHPSVCNCGGCELKKDLYRIPIFMEPTKRKDGSEWIN